MIVFAAAFALLILAPTFIGRGGQFAGIVAVISVLTLIFK